MSYDTSNAYILRMETENAELLARVSELEAAIKLIVKEVENTSWGWASIVYSIADKALGEN